MRSLKLVTAAAAVALALAAPSGALASRGQHPNSRHTNASGACRVKLAVAPRLVTAGESALTYGQLTCPGGAGEASQPVTVFEHSVGAAGYTTVATTTTNAQGYFQANTPAIEADSSFYVVAGGVQSATRTISVAAQVTLAGPPESTQIKTGVGRDGRRNAVTFTGTVSPADIGATVILQRENAIRGIEWHPIDRGVVTATSNPSVGQYSITHTFLAPGDASIRVIVRSSRRNAPSVSNTLTYQISQTQNPQLTINSSLDPITFGGSLSISGAVANAPDTSVKLLARSALQNTFAPVAETKTDGNGNYTFTNVSPLVSTFYRVEGAGKSSAVLYEGVKYGLTAEASSTAIQSGQSVIFSGTVSPESTGLPIYLERENAAGTGFHVIQVGTITGTTYSISHVFYSVGTQIVRVKIPGDPAQVGTPSQTFTITVSPASSPAQITPEPPGNSSQGPQGQL